MMIMALQRKVLLPIFVMLLAVSGMSLSVVGEASSHGLAELAGLAEGPHDHSHSHDFPDEQPDEHVHHDPSNHSHESLDPPTIRPVVPGHGMSVRQLPSPIGDSPHRFRYRLERPPKAS